MSLLWKNAAAFQREGMAWHAEPGEEHYAQSAKSVRHAGYAGYVGRNTDDDDWGEDENEHGDGFDDDLWDEVRPDPTSAQERHYEEHGDYPESHFEQHDVAYQRALLNREQQRKEEDTPDHEDDKLHRFISEHGTNTAHWQQHGEYGAVSLKRPVYATQSHVSQGHIDKYLADPGATSHHKLKYGETTGNSNYLGDGSPLFVTHEGRLHAIEGHHRTAAALQRGDSHIMGWHYDADKHGFPDDNGNMPGHPDYEDPDEW